MNRIEMNREYQEKIDLIENVISMLKEEDKRFVMKILERMNKEWSSMIKTEGDYEV